MEGAMDLAEGVGESSSPPRSFASFSGLEIKNDVYNRLVAIGNEEVLSNPEFRELLDAHFHRLPASYGLDVSLDRVEDVLLHQKLLVLAKDPDNRPVFHVRLLENFGTRSDGSDEQQKYDLPGPSSQCLANKGVVPIHDRDENCEIDFEPCSKLEDLNLEVRSKSIDVERQNLEEDSSRRHDNSQMLVHEVIFSTVDKPKLLSQGSWSGSFQSQSAVEKALTAKAKFGDGEVDRRLLKIGERIAQGSCGDLYRGVYLGQDVAIKILRSEQLNEALEVEFLQEVAILREVQHVNIVRFIGACTKSPHLSIITEYMPGGSLYEYLHKNHIVLEVPQLVKFALDICKGMEYLHQNNIIHRDLKTANLLLDNHNVVKVADFGVARFQNQGSVMTAETGTYRWMAPEVINHQAYDQRADVFSFAIVLWELVTSKVPYDTMTPLQAALGVRQGLRPGLPANTHPKLLDLMQRCWEAIPTNRPSFSEIRIELEALLQEVQEDSDAPDGN